MHYASHTHTYMYNVDGTICFSYFSAAAKNIRTKSNLRKKEFVWLTFLEV